MVIRKDPEELPVEVVDFVDIYDDINGPQYWIAESEDDLTSYLLVLDGHSTIVIYKQETEELHWEAIHELGQYEYIPDTIGDGLVVFPHTFYMEFSINLTDKEVQVNANFDGTGVRAVTMPFKDVTLGEFMEVFTERISATFSSVLKPHDDKLTLKEGEVMTIPESVSSSLSLKLALMGINLQKVNVMEITPIEVEEGEIHEEVFEAPPPKEKEKEEAKKKKRARAKTPPKSESMETPSPDAPPSTPPIPGKTGVGSPASEGSPTPSPESTPKPSSTPPSPGAGAGKPPTTPKSTSVPRTPGSKGPVDISAEKKSASSIPPPPAKRGSGPSQAKPAPAAQPTTQEEEIMAASSDDVMDEEIPMEDKSELNLYAKGMDTSERSDQSLRNIHTTWFDRMVPNRAYPLVIKISTEEMKAAKSVTNQITGESRSESVDQMVVDTSRTLVVRPEFPGSIVVPAQQEVDVEAKNVTLRFHVTPLALGTLESRIIFEQNGLEIHSVELETKVIRHRVSRWSAVLGALSGTLPALMAFFYDQTPSQFMNQRLSDVSFLSGLGYIVPIILSAIFFGIAGGAYFLQRPSTNDKSVAFPR